MPYHQFIHPLFYQDVDIQKFGISSVYCPFFALLPMFCRFAKAGFLIIQLH